MQLSDRMTYSNLVAARQKAEEVARKTRSQRILTRLGNSKARQPLRTFQPTELVKIWRKSLPLEQFTGPRGGLRKSGRPGWIGPGRVIFMEVLPHQKEGEPLVSGKLFRCSVHSVRPVTPTEHLRWDLTNKEDPTRWKSLSDLLPRKEYQDITDEIPDANEPEECHLPPSPDSSTLVPLRRQHTKRTMAPEDYRRVHRSSPIGLGPSRPLSTTSPTGPFTVPDAPEVPEAGHEPSSSSGLRRVPEDGDEDVNDYDPDPKKARTIDYDIKWVQMLESEAQQEVNSLDLYSALQEVEDCLSITFDVTLDSNKQRKSLEYNPTAFLVKKMNSSEVQLQKLTPSLRGLFERAKTKEVNSFLKNEAVRKCLDDAEISRAYSTNRILKARWVLTWKSVPPEDRQEALQDSKNNPDTVHTPDGSRKAKARIVLLGFQHPSLLDPTFKTAAPVQSMIGRNLLYLMAATHQWPIEGLDLATAFLQTQPTEADAEIWTSGVEELRSALHVGKEGIMRILRNVYGSTTAPRGLWLDLHKTLVKLGAVPLLGERCLWAWFSKSEKDSTGQFPRLLGAMGGHVDDFHRVGDRGSAEWLDICDAINKAYTWGTTKTGTYRHAGTDVTTVDLKNGKFMITVNQDFYVESLMDVAIPADRLRQDGPLTVSEVNACRTALGALQWLAIQSQPLLCSRCNLLLTEVVTGGTLETAREIQHMVGEVRRCPTQLRFFPLEGVSKWTDVVFISMGDQAHSNRPQGDSTGGLVTLAAGPSCLAGNVSPMCLLSWRTWKLRRKAIGSNDAEVQSILEAEDQNFRVRLLWSELHGAGQHRAPLREDLISQAENQVVLVKGVLCTDSRGGYDAVERNESPLLGLSNLRSALQAFQLRDNLRRVHCELRWLASDYDLADAMTKKRSESRSGLERFLQTWRWCVAFDPNFVSAKRNKKAGKSALSRMQDSLGDDSNENTLQPGPHGGQDQFAISACGPHYTDDHLSPFFPGAAS